MFSYSVVATTMQIVPLMWMTLERGSKDGRYCPDCDDDLQSEKHHPAPRSWCQVLDKAEKGELREADGENVKEGSDVLRLGARDMNY
jgi:hypothetical protein